MTRSRPSFSNVWELFSNEARLEMFELRLYLMSFWWRFAVRVRGMLSRRWQDGLVRASLKLLTAVAGADGRFAQEELARIESFLADSLSLSHTRRVASLRFFRQLRAAVPRLEDAAYEFAELFPKNRTMREQMLLLLLDLAHSDREYSSEERRAISVVCRIFGFTDREYERLVERHAQLSRLRAAVEEGNEAQARMRRRAAEAEFERTFRAARESTQEQTWSEPPPREAQTRPEPYAVLGCNPHASFDEVKRAYRKLAMESHPDRLAAAGVSAEFKQAAEARFRAVRDAYEEICNSRGK